ncbi:MAG: GTPase ObgE, partial [Planctomycetota bacterium]|nr:GTPase ObgE [Planctomycetota bacterium]
TLTAMFADHAEIYVKAGDGGDGCVSMRREKYIPKGGPDGGNGGRGGDIIALADDSVQTLLDFRGTHHWRARNGEPGRGKQQTGADADDIILRLPPGVLIFNNDNGELIADLRPGDRFVVARGGEGGFGNEHFKTATNQTPTEFTHGEPGQEFNLRLELKLIADVGLVGMPNAGKSTLLSVLSRATPKIADYPFTTLTPQLGIAELDPARRLVFADIPGLIAGAAEGAGLGHDFLRHIERTRVIVHVIEVLPVDGTDPVDNYNAIRKELFAYSPVLAEKEEIIALNKLDLLPDDAARKEAVDRVRLALRLGPDEPILGLSGATRTGLRELLEACWKRVGEREPGWKNQAPAERRR